MTKDTMTVKELSAELRMSVKDLLHNLQQMGIEAKNASSPLVADACERVRNHIKGKNKTDVIVRRRKVPSAPQDMPAHAPETLANPSTHPSHEHAGELLSEHADEHTSTVKDTAGFVREHTHEHTKDEANTSSTASAPKAQTKSAKSQRTQAPNARIISPASSSPHKDNLGNPHNVTEKDTKHATHTTAAKNQAGSLPRDNAPDKDFETRDSLSHSQAHVDADHVACTHKTMQEHPEKETATSFASATSDQKSNTGATTSTTAEPILEANVAPAGVHMTDEGAESTEQAAHEKAARSDISDSDVAHQDASKNAHATSEAGTHNERGGKKRERNKNRQPSAPATPQVRVISRPLPETAEQRSARMQNAQNAQSPRDGRPHSGRPGRPQDGRDGRPQDGRDGRSQDNRGQQRGARPPFGQAQGQAHGQDNRPPRHNQQGGQGAHNSSVRHARPDMGGGSGFPTPDAVGEGQSKKKRMKGRRTVDFQQGNEFERFGHDDDNAMRLGRSHKGRRNKKDMRSSSATQPLKATKRKIRVTEAIRVADMAHQMGLKSNEIIKVLFGLGIMATINQSLDIDTATLVAAEFNYEVEKAGFSEEDYLIPTQEDKPEDLRHRPPVVTIMGHVDHGKTSLLDAIRKSNLTSGEAGGITQYIGAYHVTTERGEIVFLDTPGHEAFTAMRARGAQVTDLVILVVAADDGVMEQTREAINHSKAAGVPIMVAVNKMDKPAAQPERVLRELAELGLQAEDWGGDTVTAMVSAKSREGLDELLELVALQAEILELKANPNKPARGRIVEAKLDKGRGPVATVLIQEGTLRQGDTFVCGIFSGRVRALFNDQGKKVKEAGPSIPVEVQGFDGVPLAGEEFVCVADDKLARRIAEARATKQRERDLAKESKVTLETFLSRRASDQETLTLNLVLKADVQGTLGAITEALNKKSTDKVRINVVHGGAGAISESDILLASASQAIIIGFNVRPTAKIKEVAEHEHVEIRYYDIIYKLADDITSAMQGMLAPVQKEQYLGQAEVRETFSVPKIGVIAGCHVADGKMARHAGVRLLREGVVVYTGKITSLKRFKDDAKEVLKGYECGIGLENYNDIKIHDVIEAFEMIEEAATL